MQQDRHRLIASVCDSQRVKHVGHGVSAVNENRLSHSLGECDLTHESCAGDARRKAVPVIVQTDLTYRDDPWLPSQRPQVGQRPVVQVTGGVRMDTHRRPRVPARGGKSRGPRAACHIKGGIEEVMHARRVGTGENLVSIAVIDIEVEVAVRVEEIQCCLKARDPHPVLQDRAHEVLAQCLGVNPHQGLGAAHADQQPAAVFEQELEAIRAVLADHPQSANR